MTDKDRKDLIERIFEAGGALTCTCSLLLQTTVKNDDQTRRLDKVKASAMQIIGYLHLLQVDAAGEEGF